MNPLFGILLAALMFAVFGVLHRRDTGAGCGTDPSSCDKADSNAGCSACHPIHESTANHESTESSHGRF